MAKGKGGAGLTVSLKLYGKDGKKLSHAELELKPEVTQEEATRLYEEILATVTTKAAVMSQSVGGA